MIPDGDMIDMLMEDIKTLQHLSTVGAKMREDMRNRLHKALKKNLLMEILLTMDLPRDRIVLSKSNVFWLLRNIQINNPDHPELDRAKRLLKEFVETEGAAE